MKLAKKHDKGMVKKKKKKKKKKNPKKSKRKPRPTPVKGREGVDFKTFDIDPNKPSTCRPRIERESTRKRKCKSHRMRIPKVRMNKKKCNESFVQFINL